MSSRKKSLGRKTNQKERKINYFGLSLWSVFVAAICTSIIIYILHYPTLLFVYVAFIPFAIAFALPVAIVIGGTIYKTTYSLLSIKTTFLIGLSAITIFYIIMDTGLALTNYDKYELLPYALLGAYFVGVASTYVALKRH